ncbi:VanZ family protein [Streptomyces sp. NPDC057249]|uniref:VanZ family protein n=1 Tax=Streptomyces sp. NPDC057249 TaxID=3346067 RepID=UPI0036306FE3
MDAAAAGPQRGTARRKGWGRLLLRVAILALAFVAMVGFSVVLAKVTLTPSPASEELVKSNLHPGRSLRQYAEDYTFVAACKQAGGNLVLGMPFGILLPILVPRRLRMLRMFLLTVAVIVLVELVQGAVVPGRAFDVDDVILNTAGALLAYLLVGRRLSHRYHVLAEGAERAPADRPGTAPRTEPKPRPKPASRRAGRPAPVWSRLRHGVRRRAARGRSRKR